MNSGEKAISQLLSDARGGDKSAINRLMNGCRDDLRLLVRMRLDRKIRKRVDTSDVVQDILVEAFRRLRSYLENPGLPFPDWLRMIARDRMIEAYRKHRKSANRSMDREETTVLAGLGQERQAMTHDTYHSARLTPAAQAIQREISSHIEDAITRLSATDSEIIIMRHYEMLSNQEISHELRLSESAVSVRYVRALRRLKSLLHANC